METNKNYGAAECGDCNECNKCDEKATRNEINNAYSVAVPKKSGEGMLLCQQYARSAQVHNYLLLY